MTRGLVLQVGRARVKIKVDDLGRSANGNWAQPLTVILLGKAANGTSYTEFIVSLGISRLRGCVV